MHLTFTGTYEIDIEAEKARINKCFVGSRRQRQMDLLDLFVRGKLKEWCEAYNNLPYDSDSECSEKEYVGLYSDIIHDFQYAKFEIENVSVSQS